MATDTGSTTPTRRPSSRTLTRDIVVGVGTAVVLWGLLSAALPFYREAARHAGAIAGGSVGLGILALGSVGGVLAFVLSPWSRLSAAALGTTGVLFGVLVAFSYSFPGWLPSWALDGLGPVFLVVTGMLLVTALLRGASRDR